MLIQIDSSIIGLVKFNKHFESVLNMSPSLPTKKKKSNEKRVNIIKALRIEEMEIEIEW